MLLVDPKSIWGHLRTSLNTCQMMCMVKVYPKRGLIGPTNTANILGDVLDSLGMFIVSFSFFFGGVHYSKMANLDSWTYCNSFWNIFGTSNKSTKYGPWASYLLQKYFKPHKKMIGIFTYDFLRCGKFVCLCFLKLMYPKF